jgi:hypothetical protein
MNNILRFEIELKNSKTCVKKCFKNEILFDFKNCYKICDNERKRKDVILHKYVFAILKNITDPQMILKTNKSETLSHYDLPDWYFKSKDDDFSIDAKKNVGSLFGRNK